MEVARLDCFFSYQAAQVIDRKIELVHGLWTPPAEQIVQVRRWNDLFGWGFKPEAFVALEQLIPAPSESRLTATTIEICLPKGNGMNPVQRTVEELWRIAAMRQDRHYRWDALRSDSEHLKLLDGIEHTPGLRWVRDDMGANWEKSVGMYPLDVRGPRISPHASILSAAALHPAWVQAMDEINIPHVWISGYMVTVFGSSAWGGVPYLGFFRGDREVFLNADGAGSRFRGYAVPSLQGVLVCLRPLGPRNVGLWPTIRGLFYSMKFGTISRVGLCILIYCTVVRNQGRRYTVVRAIVR